MPASPVLAGDPGRHRCCRLLLLGLAFKMLLVDPMLRARRAAAGDRHHGAGDRHQGSGQDSSSAPRPRPSPRSCRPVTFRSSAVAVVAAEPRRAGARDRRGDRTATRCSTGPRSAIRCRRRRRIRRSRRIIGVPVERMILLTFLINAFLVALASLLDHADLSGEILQRRSAGTGGLHRGDRRRLQPGARRHRRRARLIGVVDNLSAAYVSTQYRAAVPLILLIVIILFRPQGLLGRPEERTV